MSILVDIIESILRSNLRKEKKKILSSLADSPYLLRKAISIHMCDMHV